MTFRRHLALFLALSLPLVAQEEKEPPSPPKSENEAQKIAREIQKKVEAIRGHRFKEPVKIGVYRRDELLEVVKEKTMKEFESPESQAQTRALRALGLLPPQYDFKKGALDFLAGNIAGFYDPAAKELFLIQETDENQNQMMQMAGMTNEVIVFHELVHALQDQVWGLQPFIEGESNLDVAQAKRTLVEGDATFNMTRLDDNPMLKMNYAMMPSSKTGMVQMTQMAAGLGLDEEAMAGQDAMMKAPAVLLDPMLFDYADGYRFVVKLVGKKKDGEYDLSPLDAAFANPPLSTEQILHPRKYTGEEKDWPTTIALPDLAAGLGKGWSLVYENTLGELLTRTWLNEFGIKRVRRIHRGWDGDRFAVFAKEGKTDALLWMSTWDRDVDAREFAEAARAVLLKKYPERALEEVRPWLWRMKSGDSAHALLLRSKEVLLAENIPAERLDGLLLDALVGASLVERRR
jgi:hypothetical protein